MKIKYVGSRPFVSTVLSSRGIYYFGPENDFTVDVTSQDHVSELLRSSQHRFQVIMEAPKEPEKKVEKIEKPVKEPVEKKKKGKKNA